MQNTRSVNVIPICVLALAAVALCAPAKADDGTGLYKQKCAACHGPDGKGEIPMGKKLAVPNLSSPEVQNQSDAQLTDVISKGKNKMPGYGKTLKDGEIKGLVAFIRELAKKT